MKIFIFLFPFEKGCDSNLATSKNNQEEKKENEIDYSRSRIYNKLALNNETNYALSK